MTTPEKPGMNELIQKAQMMQDSMRQAHEEAKTMEVEGEAHNGLVKVTRNGRHEVLRIDVDPSLNDEPLSVILELIITAENEAVKNVEKALQDKLLEMTKGLNLPDNFSSDQSDDV